VLSLSRDLFLVFSVAMVLRATDRFSGSRTVELCRIVKPLYHRFDGNAFLKTVVSLLESISSVFI
jgi:hypothetical protein